MSANQISLALDCIGVTLMIMLMFSTRHTARNVAYDNRIYHRMLKHTLYLNLLDLSTCLIRFTPLDVFSQLVLMVLASLIHLLQILVSLEWVYYVDYRTHQDTSRLHGTYRALLISPFVISLVLLTLNLFTHFLFSIGQDGSYQSTPLVAFLFGFAFLYVLYSISIPLFKRMSWRHYRQFPVFLFLIPVLIGNLLHLLYMQVAISWVAMALGFISLQLNMQNDISYQDPLTGLHNRLYLNQHLQNMFQAMDNPDNDRQLVGILIDLDLFKEVNDQYGHMAGDQLLQEMGMILRECLPLDAVACRFGGDEFVVVTQVEKREDVPQLIERIKARTARQNQRSKHAYQLHMSIGWTLYARHADTMDSFFTRMDEKMYREKDLHHAQYQAAARKASLSDLL